MGVVMILIPGRMNGLTSFRCVAACRSDARVGFLPACFMATGSLDLFLDEDIDYALRLIRAGIPTELHSYPGAIHAFDMITQAAVSRRFATDLSNALKRVLAA